MPGGVASRLRARTRWSIDSQSSVSFLLSLLRSLTGLQLPLHREAAIGGDRDAGSHQFEPVCWRRCPASTSASPTSRSPLQRSELLTEA